MAKSTMFKAVIILLFLIPYWSVGGCTDSLVQTLNQPTDPDTASLALAQLSIFIVYSKPNSAMWVLRQALAFSQKINYATDICIT